MNDRRTSPLRQRWPLAFAGVIVVAVTVGYGIIIERQGTTGLSDPVPVFVMVYLTLLAGAAGAGLTGSGRMAGGAAAAATGGLFAMGVLGIFSIGLPLLVAAGFAAWGLVRVRRASTHPAWHDAIVAFGAAAAAPVLLFLR